MAEVAIAHIARRRCYCTSRATGLDPSVHGQTIPNMSRARLMMNSSRLWLRQRFWTRADGPAGYLAALAIGLGLAFSTFPHWALSGAMPSGPPPRPDFGKDVSGQLYFFSQSWHSSGLSRLLVDRKLDVPWGASIAFTDSMPLVTVVAKALRPLLPSFEQTITLYQAAAWVLLSSDIRNPAAGDIENPATPSR